jgi:Protein of unknown function (DUF4031)
VIYVDPLFTWGGSYRSEDAAQAERVGARNGHRWCHLFSDEPDAQFPALHAFAARLGLRRAWFQGDHYDLTPGRRAAAIAAGARAVSYAEAVVLWRAAPRARRFRCKACGFVTSRTVTPPAACPHCTAV